MTHKEAVSRWTELEQLKGMNLPYPDNEDIEEARSGLRECLEEATETQCGVVAFYY